MGSNVQKLPHKSEPLQPLPVTSRYWWPPMPCVSLVFSQETSLCAKPNSCVNSEEMGQQPLTLLAQLFGFWILWQVTGSFSQAGLAT